MCVRHFIENEKKQQVRYYLYLHCILRNIKQLRYIDDTVVGLFGIKIIRLYNMIALSHVPLSCKVNLCLLLPFLLISVASRSGDEPVTREKWFNIKTLQMKTFVTSICNKCGFYLVHYSGLRNFTGLSIAICKMCSKDSHYVTTMPNVYTV